MIIGNKLLTIALLLSCGLAHGAPVLFDFEDVAAGTNSPITKYGFEIRTIPSGGSDFYGTVVNDNGNNVYAVSNPGPYAESVTYIERLDGETFDLLALDILYSSASYTYINCGVPGSAGCEGVTSVSISFSDDYDLYAKIDNIVVTPIPAAVWLFASGLGLLGWFRRTTGARDAGASH